MRAFWIHSAVVAAGVFAACTFNAPHEQGAIADASGDAHDSYVPDAGPCTAIGSTCAGDQVRTCTSLEGTPSLQDCAWGCIATDDVTARCALLSPHGGSLGSAQTTPEAGLDDIAELDGSIDSDTGAISGVTTRITGIGIIAGIDYEIVNAVGMFHFKSLNITGNVAIMGTRPVAFVVDGDITIGGVVDLRGDCVGADAGPGGFAGGTSTASATGSGGGTGGGTDSSAGGGGGGHGESGGNGGQSSGSGPAGGSPFGDGLITTLAGGGGGGGGGGGVARGGGGGGALQIAAGGAVHIVMTQGINAGGCGGAGPNGANGGGGGGAGGTILIEGVSVAVDGTLAVNGGGGGAGDVAAGNGGNGTLDRMPSKAGHNNSGSGPGAPGGAAASAAGSANDAPHAGGGGGGVGWIRINTRNGAAITGMGKMSPAFDDVPTTASAGSAAVE